MTTLLTTVLGVVSIVVVTWLVLRLVVGPDWRHGALRTGGDDGAGAGAGVSAGGDGGEG